MTAPDSSRKQLRALVVEDDRVTRGIIERELKAFGFDEVAIAPNGRAGLVEFLHGDYRLVVTDWNMPDGNGMDLTLGIRASGSSVPIVMATSESGQLRVKSAILAGVDDYIVKPIDKTIFFAKIANLVERIERKDPATPPVQDQPTS